MRNLGGSAVVLALFSNLAGCPAQYEYARRAAPVERTVALVESDPRVAAALGRDVAVSLAVARIFERDFLNAKIRGRDRVALLTTARGSSGEAWLDVHATNINAQGWAGTFSLRTDGRQVLRDGRYETVGAATVLAGTFAPDGTPRVATTE
jgi:hypothetical protein